MLASVILLEGQMLMELVLSLTVFYVLHVYLIYFQSLGGILVLKQSSRFDSRTRSVPRVYAL